MKNPKIEKVIKEYAKQYGYTGLFNSDIECGCLLNDLAPCGNDCLLCEFGYWTKCENCEEKETCELHNIEGNYGCVRSEKVMK